LADFTLANRELHNFLEQICNPLQEHGIHSAAVARCLEFVVPAATSRVGPEKGSNMLAAFVLSFAAQGRFPLPFPISLQTVAVMAVIFLLFGLTPYWRIVTKAGYPGSIALLFFIPVLNVIMLFWFAFSEWPIERQAAQAEMRPGSLPW
jgi:hypothetical protein